MMIDGYKALIKVTKGVVCLLVALLIFIIAFLLEGFNSNVTHNLLVISQQHASYMFNWLDIYVVVSYVIAGLIALFGFLYYILATFLDYVSELFVARNIKKNHRIEDAKDNDVASDETKN